MAALIAVAAVAVLLLIFLSSAVRVAREYERGVIFRLGRLKSPPKGPGLFLLIPIIDKMVRVDLRTVTLNVPPQEVITKDNVPVRVNAVAYFRIIDPENAIVQIENFMVATSQISQTTLRSVLGQHPLDELLSERDKINAILQQIIDEATSPWGIKVSIVEVKDVEIPGGMQRAMARQAEAERERRAKVIAAEGEFQASERLKDAAQVLSREPDVAPAPVPADDARDQLGAVVDDHPARADRALPAADRSLARLRAEELTPPDFGTTRSRAEPSSSRRLGRAVRAQSAARSIRLLPKSSSSAPSRGPRGPHAARDASRSRRLDGSADSPGWQVRVVPNLYPAFEHQEVVVHTPRHVRSIAELTDDELAPIAAAWHQRREAARAAGFAHPYLLVNEGREAGASLPHSHSQLVWLREAAARGRPGAPRLHKATARSARCSRRSARDRARRGPLATRRFGRPRSVRAADRAARARGRALGSDELAVRARAPPPRDPSRLRDARRAGAVERLAARRAPTGTSRSSRASPSSPGSSSAPACT